MQKFYRIEVWVLESSENEKKSHAFCRETKIYFLLFQMLFVIGMTKFYMTNSAFGCHAAYAHAHAHVHVKRITSVLRRKLKIHCLDSLKKEEAMQLILVV